MLERLVESWLDSASERSYQRPFCQALAHDGHTVVHSTRHAGIELGKDVITIAPDRRVHAYQLKGNPGSAMRLPEFRAIQGQLLELAVQPINVPRTIARHHRSFLVTNGEVHEEVRLSLDQFNQHLRRLRVPPVELIARGHLLEMFTRLGTNLWPSELRDIKTLLELLVSNGRETLPTDQFHTLLSAALGLDAEAATVKGQSLRRRITSAGIATAIALTQFSREANHVAEIQAWTLYAVYVIAACERVGSSVYEKYGRAAVTLAQEAIFGKLSELCSELEKDPKTPIEGVGPQALVDGIVLSWRWNILAALMAVYWFWSEERGWISEKHQETVQSLADTPRLDLWGEAAVPQLLLYFWLRSASTATIDADFMLSELTSRVVALQGRERCALASPYFSYQDVMRHRLREMMPHLEDPLERETRGEVSYVVEALLHLLVRTNLKTHCKLLWPDASRVGSRSFVPASPWEYCLWRSKHGAEEERQWPYSIQWDDLVTEAADVAGGGIPRPLRESRYLSALFLVVAPHRATPAAIRRLGWQFNPRWHMTKAPVGA